MKILCVEPLRYDDDARAALEVLGEVAWEDCADQAEFVRALARAPWDVLVTRLGLAVDAAALAAAPSLRVVATPTTGVDHIATEALGARGARLVSLRGETAFLESIRATAEHSFALLLALARRLPSACADVAAGRWRREPFLGFELHGKSLGIIGCGRLGRMVAGYGLAFGMRVLAHDTDATAIARAPAGTAAASAEDALGADVVSLHLPLNADTRGWLSAARLALLRPGALRINTARGELIDEAALLPLLHEGHLGGAALDVLAGDGSWDGHVAAREHHALVDFASRHPDRLLITPHIGGYGRESITRTRRFLIERLRTTLETETT